MERRTLLSLTAAFAAAACAPMPDANPIGREARASLAIADVEVVTSGAQFESRLAADRATRLGPDLRAALRQEFADRLRPDGVRMVAEIARVNLTGSTRTAFGQDRSRLLGTVRVLDRNGALLGAYPIQIEAGTAAETRTGALARASVTTVEGFYRSLVRDFARQSREQILGADLPGQRLFRRVTTG